MMDHMPLISIAQGKSPQAKLKVRYDGLAETLMEYFRGKEERKACHPH